MSLILAMITSRDGIVASDGRRFGSARFEGGQIVEPALVESEEFDKTFSVGGGKVIGAFAGLMSFTGKDVAEHIDEIFQDSASTETELNVIAAKVAEGIKSKLSNINQQEVIFECRKLDVLLIGCRSQAKRELEIARLRFSPSNREIVVCVNIYSSGNQIYHALFGDDKATAIAHRLLSNNRAPNRNAGFLKKLALRAMSAGR